MEMRRLTWSLPLVTMVIVACDSTGPRGLSLSVTTKLPEPSASVSSPSGFSADVQVGNGTPSVSITSAQIVLAEIELSGSGPCSASGEDDNCAEVELGPLFVDLPVNGTTKAILDAQVPAGSYSELEAELDAVMSGEESATTFLTEHSDLAGLSVRVSGVFTDADGMPHNFTFTSNVEAEIEMTFSPPVTVGASTSNLTIDVDLGSWFKDASGAVIDPTNPTTAEAINANIKRSFKAFEDDDRDGAPDSD